jgi:hypothetical protein
MTDSESNLAQWVSEYPDKVAIIHSPILRAFFARTPPPNEKETPEWTRLLESLNQE